MNNVDSTLIILDWDDTLFPSSWLLKNKINITTESLQLFHKLDNILAKLLVRFSHYGRIIIVTNAHLSWVDISSNLLPKTKKILTNITIISAKQTYMNKSPNPMSWKKYAFADILSKLRKIKNVISIGDAEYEYQALISLYNKKRILKTVKFMQNPDYATLLDQLNVLYNAAKDICTASEYLDINFANRSN